MELSGHFTLSELTKSSVADRYNVDNTPGKTEIKNLKLLVKEILEPARLHYNVPISPSSGYRCMALNRLLGSKDTSQHTKGQAVDFEVPGITNEDLANWIRSHCKFDQLILEFYHVGQPHSGWVHVSVVEENNRHESLTFDGKTYTKI